MNEQNINKVDDWEEIDIALSAFDSDEVAIQAMEDRGAGTEFGLAKYFTPNDKSPVSFFLVLSKLISAKFFTDIETVDTVADTKYDIRINRTYKFDDEAFIFLTILRKFNNDSLSNFQDNYKFEIPFDELDNYSFMKHKGYRKRFNEEELKKAHSINMQEGESKISTDEALNRFKEFKRLNDSIYESFAMRSSRIRFTVSVEKPNSKIITDRFNLFNRVVVNHEEQCLQVELSSSFCNMCRIVEINRYYDIELLRSIKCVWTRQLYSYLMKFQDSKELFFYQDNFTTETNLDKKVERNNRAMIFKSLKQLEELGVVEIPKKYQIMKNKNTKFHFKRVRRN